MRAPTDPRLSLAIALVAFALAAHAPRGRATIDGAVDYTRDVQPILDARCTRCHGTEKQKAGLRLDSRAHTLAGSKSGQVPVVVPGASAKSELYLRVASTDEDERMPATGDPLTKEQIEILRAWIDQGAHGPEDGSGEAGPRKHWAYVAPTRAPLPAVKDARWPRNAIDRFVLARLESERIAPSPEADPSALLRRASIDLTGLAPTIAELDTFLADAHPDAYERAVDRLLASPHYGEHMARSWLDLARYADTNGYEKDQRRVAYLWRDWVIDAFNRDLPFDQFTVQQLAGDLLPDAGPSERIATGFHRNTMLNQEGGTDPEEFRVAAVVDRVNTTASVWLGSTLACAQCHDHKYDPFSQREYYELLAFFDQSADDGAEFAPVLAVPTREQNARFAEIDARERAIQAELEAEWPDEDVLQVRWEERTRASLPPPIEWRPLEITSALSENGATLTRLDDRSVLAGGALPPRDVIELLARPGAGRASAFRLETLTDPSLPHSGPGRASDGNFVLTGFEVELSSIRAPQATRTILLVAAAADLERRGGFRAPRAIDGDPSTGWALGIGRGAPHEIVFAPEAPLESSADSVLRFRLRCESPFPTATVGRVRLSIASSDAAAAEVSLPEMTAWESAGPYAAASFEQAFQTKFAAEPGFEPAEPSSLGASAVEWTRHPEWIDGEVHAFEPLENSARYLRRTIRTAEPRALTLYLGSDDALAVWKNGELVLSNFVARGPAVDQDRVEVELPAGESQIVLKIANGVGTSGFFFEASLRNSAELSRLSVEALRTPPSGRTDKQRLTLRDHYRQVVSARGARLASELDQFRAERSKIDAATPTALVMAERAEPRKTHVMIRGSFLAQGDEVSPGVPASLTAFPADAPRNRLGLARWLVDPRNPLTARVEANRLWAELFGTGLVATVDDFGTRGEAPSHPELLDLLALDFVEHGWSVKQLLREIVTSSTYRQSSRTTPDMLERDPANRLLARGPRVRVPAEVVRDLALEASGLLSAKVGGPSVFPAQVEGIWNPVYSDDRWTSATNEDRYRRGLYTFLRRTSPYPTFLLFDATSRELACTRRARTNTPLQALALLNDPAFVECAGALAQRMLAEAGPTEKARAEHGFRLCLARMPDARELAVLLELYRAERSHYSERADAAAQLATASGARSNADPAELAAWTVVANALLNLDEFLTNG